MSVSFLQLSGALCRLEQKLWHRPANTHKLVVSIEDCYAGATLNMLQPYHNRLSAAVWSYNAAERGKGTHHRPLKIAFETCAEVLVVKGKRRGRELIAATSGTFKLKIMEPRPREAPLLIHCH